MKYTNRRHNSRLRIDRRVRVPIHLFPVMPFIGKPLDAGLVNLSNGGMALVVDDSESEKKVKRGVKIKLHFHLPGSSIKECQAKISHRFVGGDGRFVLGIKFIKPSSQLVRVIEKMILNNDVCDKRIRESDNPSCEMNCSFYQLCRKPIRIPHGVTQSHHLEIAFQNLDDTLTA